MSNKNMSEKISETLKNTILIAIEESSGIDVKAIFVDTIVGYTDWIIIVTGTSTRHTKTLSYKIEEKVRETLNIKVLGIEGEIEGEWILADFGDAVVHIFIEETRDYYQLEQLYSSSYSPSS